MDSTSREFRDNGKENGNCYGMGGGGGGRVFKRDYIRRLKVEGLLIRALH